MTKRMKKRKILLSAFAIIMICASLICASTYALFTSESETNIAVTSGKVNVKAKIENIVASHYDDNKKMDVAGLFSGKKVEFNEGVLALYDIVPGDKISFDITIENQSSVSINYQTKIACLEGVELMRGLEVSVGTEINTVKGLISYTADWNVLATSQNLKTIPVLIEFPYSQVSQNEFQGLTTKLNFLVNAVQGNAVVENPTENIIKTNEVETDSFEALQSALKGLVPTYVKLLSDIYAPESLVSVENALVTIDFNGYKVYHTREENETKNMNLFNLAKGSKVVLKNGFISYDNSAAPEKGKSHGYTVVTSGELTLDNMNISDLDNWSALVCTKEGAKLEILSGTYVSDIQYALKIDELSEAVIYDGTFISNCTKAYTILNAGTLTIYDGTFLAPSEDHVYSLGVLAGYDLQNNVACKTVTNIYGGYFSSGNPDYGLVMPMNGMTAGSFEKVNGGIEFNVYGGVFDGYFLWSTAAINMPLTPETTQNVYDEKGNLVAKEDIIPDVITIYGGKYIDTWPFTEESCPWYHVADNHSFVLDKDSWWNVVEGTAVASEEELVAAIEQGGKIVLANDVELNSILEITEDTTIDLFGNTLINRIEYDRVFKVKNANFEIHSSQDGGELVIPEDTTAYGFIKIENPNTSVVVDHVSMVGNTDIGAFVKAFAENWNVILNDVNVDTNYQAFCSSYAGELTVNGGSYTFRDSHEFTAFYLENGAIATFNNVVSNSLSRPFIEIYNAQATFNDCILGDQQSYPGNMAYFASTINVSGGSKVIINGGQYKAKYAVYICNSGGVVEINGGTFNGSTYDLKADGVVASILENYPDRVSKFIINSGTFVNNTMSATSGAVIEDNRGNE